MNIYDLNRIKTEFCATCLSQNRVMFTVNDFNELLLFCSDIVMSEEDLICWECKAMLKKMQQFKFRATQAQKFLNKIKENQVVYVTSSVRSLSHLKISDTDQISFGIESQPSDVTHDNDEEIKPIVEVDMIKYEIDFESNNDYSDNTEINLDVLKIEKDLLTFPTLTTCDTQNEKKIAAKYVSNKTTYKNKSISMQYKTKIITQEELSKRRQKKFKSKNFQKAVHKCSTCLLSFRDQCLLNKHIDKRHSESAGQFVCDICEQRFQFKKEMKIHITEHYKWYMCVECSYECNRPEILNKHCKFKHENNPKTCKICGKVFPTRLMYFYHLKTHRLQLVCDHCGKGFSDKRALVRHLGTHADAAQLECVLCHKKLQTWIGLKCHMSWHNKVANKSIDQSAYCAACNKLFKHVYLYRQHLKTSRAHIAESDMKYKCPHCDKGFPMKAYIKTHIAYHHTDKRNHICQICNKGFPIKEKLVTHIKIKHEGMKRPKNHMCDFCSKTFYNKATLQEHINSHTGRRPYACEFCDATFGYSAARFTHVKLKHKQQKQQKDKQKQLKENRNQQKDKGKQQKDNKRKHQKDKGKQQKDKRKQQTKTEDTEEN